VVKIQFDIVGTIIGGFTSGDTSSSTRKRHYRSINLVNYLPLCSQPPITFSDVDFFINDPNQDDSVVITATIANWRVHKILIDQGSSADVLFHKLNVPESAVKSYIEPLLGFAGQRVHAQ